MSENANLTITQPRDVIYLNSTFVPHHIVSLHRLAKMGKAHRYGNWRRNESQLDRCAQFDFVAHPEMAGKWEGLQGVDRITLLYNERRDEK